MLIVNSDSYGAIFKSYSSFQNQFDLALFALDSRKLNLKHTNPI
jgi:hypothetical protein